MLIRCLPFLLTLHFLLPIKAQYLPDPISEKYNTFFTEVNHEMWFASTMEGFNRYRGFETKYYFLNDSISGLEGSTIQSGMYKDKQGLLWTSTYENLCYFNPESDRFNCFNIGVNDLLVNQNYRVFHLDAEENLLYLRAGDQLCIYDIAKKEVKFVLGETNGNHFTKSGDTILASPWLNALGLEVWIYQNQEWKRNLRDASSCELSNPIRVIKAFHHKNNMWLVTLSQGLIKLDLSNQCTVYFAQGNPMTYSSAVLKQDKILISTIRNAVQIFDLKAEKFIPSPKIQEDRIDDIFVTSTGQVWTSNFDRGITSFPLMHLVPDSNTLNINSEWSGIDHKYGTLFLFDNNKKITSINNTTNSTTWLYTKDVPIQKIHRYEIIGPDQILISDNKSCFLLDITKQRAEKLNFHKEMQFTLMKRYLDTLFYIADNQLHYTLISRGFPTGKRVNLNHQGNYQSIETCLSDVKSFAINSTFLYIHHTGRDTLINLKSFINKSIFDPSDTIHYVGTTAGLFKIDPQFKIHKITYDFISNQAKSITQLVQDKNWVYFTEVDRIGRVHKKTGEIKYFFKNSYPSTPAIKVQNDTIFLAHNYVEQYKTEDAFQPLSHGKLILDLFSVNEINATNLYRDSKSIKLKNTQNRIQFKFYINHWETSHFSKIRYRISPITTSWTVIENGALISSPYLTPDHYTLEVQGIAADGQVLDLETYVFQIMPPWYKSAWFISLIITLIGVFGFVFYKYRIYQIQEKYRIKNEMMSLERSALQAQMNPHFIFNCLNSIQNYIMRNDKDLAMDYLGRFARLIRQFLNASTLERVTLEDEISMLENYLKLEQMRFNQNFEYRFEIENTIDTTVIKLPPLLIQPFIENAVVHGMTAL